jgi:hypothetical protein
MDEALQAAEALTAKLLERAIDIVEGELGADLSFGMRRSLARAADFGRKPPRGRGRLDVAPSA